MIRGLQDWYHNLNPADNLKIKDLCRAVRDRNVEMVEKLLASKGMNINLWNDFGCYPVHFLYNYNLNDGDSKEIFDLIVNYPNVDFNVKRKNRCARATGVNLLIPNDSRLLHVACSSTLVEELLRSGKVDVSAVRKDPSALSRQIEMFLENPDKERFKICKVLLENGAYCRDIKYGFQNLHLKLILKKPGQDTERGLKANSLIKYLLDLPFNALLSVHLLWLIEYADEENLQKIYSQWNEVEWDKIWDTFFEFNDCFCANNLRLLFTYFYNKRKTMTNAEANLKPLMKTINCYSLSKTFNESSEFVKFFDFLTTYKKLDTVDILYVFSKNLDSSILRKAIRHVNDKALINCKWLFLFLQILLNPKLNLNDDINFLDLSNSCPISYLFETFYYRPFCNLPIFLYDIELYMHYCTISRRTFEYTENEAPPWFYNENVQCYRGGLSQMLRKHCERPKSLMELTRNVLRFHLATLHNIQHPRDMENFIDQLKMPQTLTEIIKLEKPIYMFDEDQDVQPLAENVDISPEYFGYSESFRARFEHKERYERHINIHIRSDDCMVESSILTWKIKPYKRPRPLKLV